MPSEEISPEKTVPARFSRSQYGQETAGPVSRVVVPPATARDSSVTVPLVRANAANPALSVRASRNITAKRCTGEGELELWGDTRVTISPSPDHRRARK